MLKTTFAGAFRRFSAITLGLAAIISAGPAGAVIDPTHQFIVNGGFETTTNGLGQLKSGYTGVTGWTNQNAPGGYSGYTYVLNASTATTTGSPGESQLKLWPGVNGQTLTNSPTGGNFIGADGGYHIGTLTQTLTNLIVGQTYALTFNFAGAQEYGYNGASTDAWKFKFGTQGSWQQTASLNNVEHGFTGWQAQSYNFVATSTSDTINFMALGTPAGQPPFSLLDSVSLIGAWENGVPTAPEPGTWLMMLIGFGIVGFSLRRRQPTPASSRAFA